MTYTHPIPEIDGWLRATVCRALDNTVANGYQVGDPDEEATELSELDAELEGVPPERIAPYVAEWLAAGSHGDTNPPAVPVDDEQET